MSINIWTDSMQHAALLGKPVLFTNWLIQRDIIPEISQHPNHSGGSCR